MKRYLVIKNSQYYPSAGTGDWNGPYTSLHKARLEASEWEKRGDGNHSYVMDLLTLTQGNCGEPDSAVNEMLDELEQLRNEVQKYKLKAMEFQGMADCMDMVMQELERAGVIPAHTAPMFAPEAILSYIHKNVIK